MVCLLLVRVNGSISHGYSFLKGSIGSVGFALDTNGKTSGSLVKGNILLAT